MEDDELISKTRRKRQMHELQAVGAALVKLSAEKLARIDLPESLREAVADARGLTKHEARRRQVQYIGRLMRDIDAAPIIEQLNELEKPSKRQTAIFHVAERWRQELVDDPENVERFVKEYPAADASRLRTLAQAAKDEKGGARALRNFRELFHVLNAILQKQARGHP